MHKITLIGLGHKDKNDLPLNQYMLLKKAEYLIVNTTDHPVLDSLLAEGRSFDVLNDFSELPADVSKLAAVLIEKVNQGPVTYAVPGFISTEDDLLVELKTRYGQVEVIQGKSFLEALVSAVNVDPLEGIQLINAGRLQQDSIQTGQPVFVTQLNGAVTMTEVKSVLMTKYPTDHTITVINSPGNQDEKVSYIPLNELDQASEDGEIAATSLFCPPLSLDEQVTSLSTLQHYIDQVTAPEGDVWINEQTPRSLIRYLKEETGELIEAIEKEDTANWKEELGDVLVQILYQTSAAEKEGLFSFEDVLTTVNRKIRRRHPHVFDGVEANTPEEVDAIWQKIKREEKRMKDET